MKKYEVVCTDSYLDIGIAIETDWKLKPKRVRARADKHSLFSEYGAVEYLHWIHTGIFLSEEEWKKLSFNKPTEQILKELHIREENIHQDEYIFERVNEQKEQEREG